MKPVNSQASGTGLPPHAGRDKHPRRSGATATPPRTAHAGPSDPQPGPSRFTRREHLLLLGVFLLALALRLAYLAGQAAHNPTFSAPIMDMRVHHEWASQVAAGQPLRGLEGRPYFRAPLYYYALGMLYKLTGPHVWAGRLAGCVLGAASCWLMALLGARLAGFRVGLVTGVVAAIYWPFWYYDAELKTVGLEVFLNILLLLALLRAVRQDRGWAYALAGLVWGLSAITRPNVLAVLPGLVLWMWLMLRGAQRLKRTAAAGAWFVVGGAVAIAPVALRNLIVGKEFVLIASAGGVNFYIGNNPYNADGFTAVVPFTRPGWWEGFEDTHLIPERELGRKLTEGEVSSYWFRKSWEWIRRNPEAWLRRLGYKLILFWTPVEVSNNQPIEFFARLSGLSALLWIGFPVVGCLGLAGLTLVRGNWREWALPLIFLVLYMGTVVLFFCPGRYRLPVVPVLIVLTGLAMVRTYELLRAGRAMPVGFAALVLTAAGALFWRNPAPELDRARFARIGEAEGHAILAAHFSGGEPGSEDLERARDHLAQAVQLRADDAYLRWRYGAVLARLGDDAGAEEQFKRGVAAARKAADPEPLYRYGQFLQSRQRWAEAATQFEAALKIQPAYEAARLGLEAARRGERQAADSDEALAAYRRTLATAPDDVPTLLKLGGALIRRGRPAEAIEPLERALRLDAQDDAVRQGLAEAYRRAQRFEDAVRTLEPAVTADRNAALLTALAWLRATAPVDALRDGAQAIALTQRARELAGQEVVQILDAQAAAHAEAGNFEQARNLATRAADLAASQGRMALAETIRRRLAQYEQGKSWRDQDDTTDTAAAP